MCAREMPQSFGDSDSEIRWVDFVENGDPTQDSSEGYGLSGIDDLPADEGVDTAIEREIKQAQKAELDVVMSRINALGIIGDDRSKVAELHERTNSLSGIVTLYLHKLSRNQKNHGPGYLEAITVDDLIEFSDRFTVHELRKDQNEQAQRIMEFLGFEQATIQKWLDYGGENLTQQLRLVGWLTNQPFMRDFNRNIRRLNAEEAENIIPQQMFYEATQAVIWECMRHFENKNRQYDTRISSELAAFNSKGRVLKGIAVMCRHILLGEEISKIKNGRSAT